MKFVFLFSLFAYSLIGMAQKVNYLDVRDELVNLSCDIVLDSAEVFGSIRRLEAFDTTTVSKNLYLYYQDVGKYYWLASSPANPYYLDYAIRAYQASLHYQPRNTKSLWNIAMAYGVKGECEKAKYYFSLYKQYLPKRYWNEESETQQGYALANCH